MTAAAGAAAAPDGSAAGLDGTLAALADPVRRRAVELLARKPLRAGELAREVGTTPSTMSKHLRVLRQRGLVTETHPDFDARVRIYALRSAPMTELRSWLDTAERAWAEQLTAFAKHLASETETETDIEAEIEPEAEAGPSLDGARDRDRGGAEP